MKKLRFFIIVLAMVITAFAAGGILQPASAEVIAVADFEGAEGPVLGQATFETLPDGNCGFTARFEEGFFDPDPATYIFVIGDIDITKNYRPFLRINPPGTMPARFELAHPCEAFLGKEFVIKHLEHITGSTIVRNAEY